MQHIQIYIYKLTYNNLTPTLGTGSVFKRGRHQRLLG
jgi:hypothetical protein